jgi:hypothetical protein
MTKE